LAWTGKDDEWVWAVTTGTTDMMTVAARHVWWSKDHGKTMQDRHPEMEKLVGTKLGTRYQDKFTGVSKVFVNPNDQEKVLLWGDDVYSFKSDDGGTTLRVVDVPQNTTGVSHVVRQHPTRPEWLLSMAYRDVCYQLNGYGCTMDLWLSQDFGDTWTNLTEASNGQVAGERSSPHAVNLSIHFSSD
jgi:hypothetical protein